YSVMVSNELGSILSADARLTVVAPLSVGVFDDSRFVDTTSGGNSGEADNVQASLRQLGHTVRTFTSVAAAVSNDVLVFPDFEAGDPRPSLDAGALSSLQNFVAQGGIAIVNGGGWNLPFIETVFGVPLPGTGPFVGSNFPRTPSSEGTPFDNGPVSVPGNDRMFALF